MIIWMKKNYQFSIDSKTKIPSFIGSLFNWRPNAITISEDSNYQKYIDSITVKDLNLEMINHIIKIIIKSVILGFLVKFLRNNVPEIPERSYALRVLDYLWAGRPFIDLYTYFYCYLWISYAIINFSVIWNFNCIIYGLILRPLLSNCVKGDKKPQEQKSLKINAKEWLILTIFYTQPLMSNPYFSISPRDFWSNQWHQMFYLAFQELGYLPVRKYFSHNRTLGNMLGICAVFLISGLVHDYIAIVVFNHFSIDFIVFFLFHALFLILWEVVEGKILGRRKNINDGFIIRIIKFSIFLPIAVFSLPQFAEPYIRGEYFYSYLDIRKNLEKWGVSN
ncbi:membrane bound O-acyl transferase family-domain-containing protein [Gigaspora rosea]|uniref:Membrane bound O-acyl transferase family-domain-containing protein n=1 Tax=Gigaspora rosea TaxID=44941 RepID=A0A397VMC9_9GLOM|nr:membrane bound O-acyl transferase family-domain-containing protein [Gigaspora rosea]